MTSTRLFPEVYMNGDRPARCGEFNEKLSLPTPAYGFGWVLSSLELFKALNITDEPPLQLWLDRLPDFVDDFVYLRWKKKGWDDTRYNPITPEAITLGDDCTMIFMSTNDSTQEMDRIIADKAYHAECRDCLNNPKTMRQEPAWFRVGLKRIPKDWIIPEQEVE